MRILPALLFALIAPAHAQSPFSFVGVSTNPNAPALCAGCGGQNDLNAAGATKANVTNGTLTTPAITGGTAVNLGLTTPTIVGGAITGSTVSAGEIGQALATIWSGSPQRSIQQRAQDVINVLDEGAGGTGATDDTAALKAAIAEGLANRVGRNTIRLPCGTYNVSSAIAISINSSDQNLNIVGDASACVFINQTADADVFDVSLTGFGGAARPFGLSGVTFVLGAATSTTRNAVLMTASTTQAGLPISFVDTSFIGLGASQYWGCDICVTGVGNPLWFDHIASLAPLNAGGVGIGINTHGTNNLYSSGIVISDSNLTGGNYGIQLGDYIQGAQLNNVSALAAVHSLSWAPSSPFVGAPEELQVNNSYLGGQTAVGTPGGNPIAGVRFTNDRFDNSTGIELAIQNATDVTLSALKIQGNDSATGQTGLMLNGNGVFRSSDLIVSNFAAAGNTPISIQGSAGSPAAFEHTTIYDYGSNAPVANTAAYPVDWTNTTLNVTPYTFGLPGFAETPTVQGNLSLTGNVSATGGYSVGATAGVSCTGAPTASYAVTNGIVTHC